MTKNELFDIITKKSSTYCNEKVFQSHFPHFYNEISALSFPVDFKFSQKLYHYFHNDYDLALGICTCGNRCHYKNFTEGYRTFCSLKCRSADENQKNKQRETCLKKYGVDNIFKSDKFKQELIKQNNKKFGCDYYVQSDDFKNKSRQKCLSKYNVPNYTQSEEYKYMIPDMIQKSQTTCKNKYNVLNYSQSIEYKNRLTEIKQKTQQTNTTRYGVPYYSQTDEYTNKTKQTNIQRYGVPYYSQTDEYKQRVILTNNIKYNHDYYTQTDEFLEKQYITKKKNNSFGQSKLEKQISDFFQQHNIKYIREYVSELYPTKCDFYLPDYDIYIEIQGYWSHGSDGFLKTKPHPLNYNNELDMVQFNRWKEKAKTSYHYKCAIKTWTITDVKKRLIAKENNLNYLEVFSVKFDECIDIIVSYLKDNNISLN